MKLSTTAYKIIFCIIVILLLVFSKKYFFRIDLTEERRFSISQVSKNILKQATEPIKIVIYLGDADANIAHLKNATYDIIREFSAYANTDIICEYNNPADAKSEKERQNNYNKLQKRGMSPITIATKDANDKVSQSIIFPWAEVFYKGNSLPVSLMRPIGMRDGENSVNSAIEELEFNFIDAIRILNRDSFDKIAFIEGHGECSEIETYSASELLSKYFQIDRGGLADDASTLNDYKAIIIANPKKPFSESDKYIIDQYIMNGGKVIWLLDAITYSKEELSNNGVSPTMILDLNLQDMLFRYGARIVPSVVQDMQCIRMPINVATVGEPPMFQQIPFTYSPLLMASPQNPITKNIMNVRANFPSFIEQVSLENGINMEVVLATSNASHIDMAPTNIDLKTMAQNKPENFTNAQFMPVGVVMSGQFESIFRHRQTPPNLINVAKRKDISVQNTMILVADGDIIKNEIERNKNGQIGIVPLGLDRINGQEYGNSSFVVNSVLALADDESIIKLRSRSLKIRLLNKNSVSESKQMWQIINLIVPILLLSIFGFCYHLLRKRKMNF